MPTVTNTATATSTAARNNFRLYIVHLLGLQVVKNQNSKTLMFLSFFLRGFLKFRCVFDFLYLCFTVILFVLINTSKTAV